MLKKIGSIFASVFLSATLSASAQTHPSAEGGGPTVWVGAEISSFNPDYGCNNNSPFTCWNHQLIGIAPFADVNHLIFRRLGAEGEARFLAWHGPNQTQQTYMGGPRVSILHFRNAVLNAKFLIGDGRITFSNIKGLNGNYLAYAPGVTVDFRVARRLYARVDYEYQFWPNFHGSLSGTGHGGLTPNGLSVGVSYALLR